MSDQALVRVTPGRPAFLNFGSARIFVAPHDEAYRIRKREFKRKIRELHPDLNPGKILVSEVPAYQKEIPAFWSISANGTPYLRRAHLHTASAQTWVRRTRSPSRKPLRKTIEAYKKFLQEEKAWYAQYGLEPPRD